MATVPPASTFLKAHVEPWLLAAFWSFAEKSDLTPSVALRLVTHHVMTRAGFTPDDYDPAAERRSDHAIWARRRRAIIDEKGVQSILIARVTPGFRAAFERYAVAQEESVAAALKAIVERVVASAKIEPADVSPPSLPELRSERVTVRFSKEEMSALQAMAGDFGSVGNWLVAVARSRINPAVPQFTRRELEALYESNRELAATARGVQRIAQALDARPPLGEPGGGGRLRAELLTLKRSIDAHTERVTGLCTESTARWSSR